MLRGVSFYLSRVVLFLPATLYALAMLGGETRFEFLKWYLAGPAVLLVFHFISLRRSSASAERAQLSARSRGLLIFSLLQFHWLLLLVPVVQPVWFWIGMVTLAVLLGGVFARTARPVPNPAVILIALGLLIALFGDGVLPLGNRGEPVASLSALDRWAGGSTGCFWNLFYQTRGCTLAEAYPEGIWLSAAALLLLQRQYVFEIGLALLFATGAGLLALIQTGASLTQMAAWQPALLVGGLTLVVLLLPGRERRSQRGWWFYGGVWIGSAALLNFSNYLFRDLHFYFQNTGAGNSWLFWVAGLFLAEFLVLGSRFWTQRRSLFD